MKGKGLKVFSSKQILQRLLILPAQVKAGKAVFFLMRLDKLSIHCIGKSESPKSYTIIYSNQCKDEYHIYEFREQQNF